MIGTIWTTIMFWTMLLCVVTIFAYLLILTITDGAERIIKFRERREEEAKEKRQQQGPQTLEEAMEKIQVSTNQFSDALIKSFAPKKKMPYIIAVDFDGTLAKNKFPEIGSANIPLINKLINRQQEGDALILWTCRKDEQLQEAVKWCKEHGLEFESVNENIPEAIDFFGGDTRKIFANEYIDDRNSNIEIWNCHGYEATTVYCDEFQEQEEEEDRPDWKFSCKHCGKEFLTKHLELENRTYCESCRKRIMPKDSI